MRRFRQQLTDAQTREILRTATSGVLALSLHDVPYQVPMSFVYAGDKLYFHCATSGKKLDLLRQNPHASFCVIAQDDVIPEHFTTHYRSVVVSGNIQIVAEEEKVQVLHLLGEKYCAGIPGLEEEIASSLSRCLLLEMTPYEMTGKQSRELMEMQAKQKEDSLG